MDVFYPQPNKEEHHGTCAVLAAAADYLNGNHSIVLGSRESRSILNAFAPFQREPGHVNINALHALPKQLFSTGVEGSSCRLVATFIEDLSKPPETVADVYLRLHLLSHRKVKPNTVNLEGIFTILPNIAWTSHGPMLPEEASEKRIGSWGDDDSFFVRSLDKIPYMLDYVTPTNVRVEAAHCARLGAYLGSGAIIMPSGFVNYNAGTDENCVIEGRVSQGVHVGDNSDLGGGASSMGTLSGGGKERIHIGNHCLIGANAGTGISLGNGCTVESGLYVTAAMKLWDCRNGERREVKARDVSGQDAMLFIRNGLTGAVEIHVNKKPNKPNPVLHKNN
jgi:2,3,4,5-tetrahydropyridine-2-carboxylate N-succinyltransferase